MKRVESLLRSRLLAMTLLLLVNFMAIVVMVLGGRYSGIHYQYFIIGLIVLFAIILIFNLLFLGAYYFRWRKLRALFMVVNLLFLVISATASGYLIVTNNYIDYLINENGFETVEYSAIALAESDLESLSTETIGFVEGTEEFENLIMISFADVSLDLGYRPFENYADLLESFLAEEIELAIVPKEYERLIETDDPENNPLSAVFVVNTFSSEVTGSVSDVDVLSEPFSVLVLGINEGLSDTIMLLTFNPQTLKMTMTSIARDSYIPIACYANQAYDKINHSRSRGRQCTIETVENLLDVAIDFYFEVDFYALVKIVDALGGIEIDSPVTFWGTFPVEGETNQYEGITVYEGLNLVDGKQALTFARERYSMPRGDFDRQLNQQYVIKQVANKILSTRNANTLVSLLDAAADNIETNIPRDSIVSLMGYALTMVNSSSVDAASTFRIVSSQIEGSTPLVGGLSVVTPYVSSLNAAKALIADNLKTTPALNEMTQFSFTYNAPFTIEYDSSGGGTVVGSSDLLTVPDFTDDWSRSEIESWGSQQGITVNFYVIDETSSDYSSVYADGQVIFQSVDPGRYMNAITSINVSIVELSQTPRVLVPYFDSDNGWTVALVESWGNENQKEILVLYDDYEAGVDDGRIIYQSVVAGTDAAQISQVTIHVQQASSSADD